jgi:putative endonuclease
MANFYFYVLLCADQSLYAGYTNDLNKRLKAHNDGQGAKYTKARRPVRLIYLEGFPDKSQALKREYWFKKILKTRVKKEKFLQEKGIIITKEGDIIMDNQAKVLAAFKQAQAPLKSAEVQKLTGLEAKEVGKVIKALQASGEVFSPKRCFYQVKD